MNFGQALEDLKAEKKVARAGWNGKGMWLQLYTPHEQEGIVTMIEGEWRWLPLSPHILMKTADNKLVPWLASQTDALAEDWQVVE
ncbi:DUF2829 domain-containing protein [Paenibacillus sp. EKM206P]|uniref:DUF2829 domain-containing protein n=1 Tax=Paenibacillus sp. EKM206P TaxID=1683674 RepID=UPI0013E9DF9C|nr:DUF2829 domain-containing protein [Paenibacillus sp. EKM206P]